MNRDIVDCRTGSIRRAVAMTEAEIAAHEQLRDPVGSNQATISTRALTALDDNRAFLALSPPTQAQALAQVRALTQQMNGVIRLVISKLDATD